MDNAAKALLIAGGILLALLTISLFVYMQQNLTTIKSAQDDKTAAEQLAKFNAEYEAFNKKYMYGADVITLLNKINENNIKYAGNTDYQIELIVYNVDGISKLNENEILNLKTNIFTCVSMNYNSTTGRINKITIQYKE